ncbi:MAG: hypothetical protein PHV34_20610 [Verrucomicrobiae bacterium]|nr:hypothetical protein [Verrucomicrobiae bacterium]
MDASPSRSSQPIAVFILLFVMTGLVAAWPAYRHVCRAALEEISRHLHKKTSASPVVDEKQEDAARLAVQIRRIPFKIKNFPLENPGSTEQIFEGRSSSGQMPVFLAALMRELSDAAQSKDPQFQKYLAHAILELAAEGRKADSGNNFYALAEALALYHSKPDLSFLEPLRQVSPSTPAKTELAALQASEVCLWKSRLKSWEIFPAPPHLWGLELHQPLHSLNRNLNLQEKASLKKYNVERAMELAMIQVELAGWLAQNARVPSDVAMANATLFHAIEPFWPAKNGIFPTASQLRENFLGLLDDQGDRTNLARCRNRMEIIAKKEEAVVRRLPEWRWVQAFCSWRAGSLLACLLLQCASLLLTWLVFVCFSPPLPPSRGGVNGSILATLGFALPTICRIFMVWPAGLPGLLLSLPASWIIWLLILQVRSKIRALHDWKACLSHTLICMLASFMVVSAAVAWFFQLWQQKMGQFLSQGWF